MKSWINNVIDSNGTDNSVPPTEDPTGGDNDTDDTPDTYQACDTCTSDQQAGLNRHNELRCLHGAQMMTATDEMNAYAQAFAEELAAADTMYHSSELGTLGPGALGPRDLGALGPRVLLGFVLAQPLIQS